MSPRWIIAAALQRELQGIHAVLRDRAPLSVPRGRVWSGHLEDIPVFLARTGIGGKKARAVCEDLLQRFSCQGIISIGYTGSLIQGLGVGDVLIAEEVLLIEDCEEKVYPTDRDLLTLARQSIGKRGSQGVFVGRMISTDRVIVSPHEKQKLGTHYAASVVEMESGYLAQLAHDFSLPFLAIRAISDDVFTTLPDYNKITEWKKEKNYSHLFFYAAMHPGEILGILRMNRYAHIASHRLTQCIEEFSKGLAY